MSTLDPHDLDVCVRCGLCLSSCPTFQLSGHEGYSPRGRIAAMQGIAAGNAPDAVVRDYVATCLGCRACEAACPSGVPYGRILEGARAELGSSGWWRGVRTAIVLWVVARRWRLSMASLPLWIAQRLGLSWLARWRVRRGGGSRWSRTLAGVPRLRLAHLMLRMGTNYVPPDGTEERGQVVLFAGCIQDAWSRDVHWATISVFTRSGWTVRLPHGQVCCGALHAHAGQARWARRLAERNRAPLGRFDGDIVVDAAGCGAHLKTYDHVLGDEGGRDLAAAIRDVHEVITPDDVRRAGARPPEGLRRIAVHDPCHLAHAQGIVAEPRVLLEAAGYELVELGDGGRCCGAAGTYSLEHPSWAEPLREAKVEAVARADADAVAVANPGCAYWMSTPDGPPGLHPMQLVALAMTNAP